ncbi:restriction endonuclease [Aliidiomarina taiwanensis]|uniref:Restriction endonuclease n=1 Tax=Aliidiomarina taiwanensis TaxID=946228 RepID=A0A432WYT0_9GAMM|nr:Cfr10I/Bse634I family restriction endonuclease [Aliidiomarina taiwanensis]RUO38877.1 restriction endonuclease [Aliidiomarina taiwanensis]
MNIDLSKRQAAIGQKTDGGLELKKAETFVNFFSDVYHAPDLKIMDAFTQIDSVAMNAGLERGALNNARGDWYEWIIGANAWNYRIKKQSPLLILNLPNKKRFDVSKLYQDKFSDQIADLRQKVSESSDVELITSNPDFVIIDTSNIELPHRFHIPFGRLTVDDLDLLDTAYQDFIGQCSFDDIRGYFSVKTTFRPDRRLQIPHEGSLMKAIHVHLQTRSWIIDPKALKYYAAATKVNNSDREALKTVATHSITNVSSKPQAAVDDVFVIDSVEQLHDALEVILEINNDR